MCSHVAGSAGHQVRVRAGATPSGVRVHRTVVPQEHIARLHVAHGDVVKQLWFVGHDLGYVEHRVFLGAVFLREGLEELVRARDHLHDIRNQIHAAAAAVECGVGWGGSGTDR